jgi:PPP family 3-phenylpropionic acid transporter
MGNPFPPVYLSARLIRPEQKMMRPAPSLRFGFPARLAAFYAAIFLLTGVQLPFFPVWLAAKGLDAGMIGVVLAMPMVLRVLAIPLAAREADRREALRAAIATAALASVVSFVLLGLSEGVVAILLANALVSLCFTPIMPLAETYALKGLGALGRAYGPVRLWGSAAFVVGTFAAGFMADTLPARYLIWLIVTAAALMALAALSLAPLPPRMPDMNDPPARPNSLLRDPTFIAVVAASSLIQGSHAVYYGFSALAWRAQGLDGLAIGALWTLGVVAEIVLFALQSRLPSFFQPMTLLTVGAIGAALRWTAMALDPPVAVLPGLQILHALSFGATHLGALSFVARHAPPGQSATAQAYLAMAQGAVMALTITASGWLYGMFGAAAYVAMALVAIAGGVGVVVARVTRRVA